MLDKIEQVETQIAALQAEQIRLTAAFASNQMYVDSLLGRGVSSEQQRLIAAEVSSARRVSITSAQIFVSDAVELVDHHPETLARLDAGALQLSSARTIVRGCRVLEPAARRLADSVIAAEAVDVLPGKVAGLVARRVIEVDPDAAERRCTEARAAKHIRVTQAEPGTAWLEALLPAEQAAVCWHALHDHARGMHADGDDRPVSHLMCDTLVERLTGVARAERLKTNIELVMTDQALLADASTPGHLVGIGPIPAGLARELATSGTDSWLRRLYTDPVDATVLLADPRRRRFSPGQAELIRLRDQHCRGIGCSGPIVENDHVQAVADHGPTSVDNGQGLSAPCHHAKHHPLVHVATDPDHNMATWRLPSGRMHITIPPPALGPGSLTPDQIHLRHRLTHPGRSLVERSVLHLVTKRGRPKPHWVSGP